MFRIVCYMKNKIVESFNEKDRQEALLYAEIMFNSGYTKVEVYDENTEMVIETF